MMEKIKNFFGSHPILWTLLALLIVVAAGLLIWYAPAFSMQADECPVKLPAKAEIGEEIPVEVNYLFRGANKRKSEEVVVAEAAGRTLTLDPVEMIFTLSDENGNTWSSAMPGATAGLDKVRTRLCCCWSMWARTTPSRPSTATTPAPCSTRK